MPQIVLEGTVFSGKRLGKKFLELTWVRRQIQQKLGFNPYPGTLNLCLSKEETEKAKQLQNIQQIIIKPEPGYYSRGLVEAKIKDLSCAIIFPHIPKYPENVLEVIAPVYLRGKFNLTDNSRVFITIIS